MAKSASVQSGFNGSTVCDAKGCTTAVTELMCTACGFGLSKLPDSVIAGLPGYMPLAVDVWLTVIAVVVPVVARAGSVAALRPVRDREPADHECADDREDRDQFPFAPHGSSLVVVPVRGTQCACPVPPVTGRPERYRVETVRATWSKRAECLGRTHQSGSGIELAGTFRPARAPGSRASGLSDLSDIRMQKRHAHAAHQRLGDGRLPALAVAAEAVHSGVPQVLLGERGEPGEPGERRELRVGYDRVGGTAGHGRQRVAGEVDEQVVARCARSSTMP